MTIAYFRCVNGHYFSGASCQFDGWQSAASVELATAVSSIVAGGNKISIAKLREYGVSEDAIKRAVIFDFGAESSLFDAVEPAGYIVKGQKYFISLDQIRGDPELARRFL